MFRAHTGWAPLGRVRCEGSCALYRLCSFSFRPFSSLPQRLSEERQLVVTEGADYFGADYDVRKDVDLERCKAACTDDAQCQAFTYNTAAALVLPEERCRRAARRRGRASPARSSPPPRRAADVEAERIAELNFLDQSYIDEARRFIGNLKDDRPHRRAASTRRSPRRQPPKSSGDYLTALDSYRAALALDQGRYDLWTGFTDAAIRAASDDWRSAADAPPKIAPPARSTPISAPSRRRTAPTRMELIGWALADRYDWKPALKAYRASLALIEDSDTRSTYDNLLAEHGFRIVDNTVEADAAAPRICLNFSDQLVDEPRLFRFRLASKAATNFAIESSGQQICIDGVEHGRRYRLTAREGLPAADGETLQKSAELDIFVRDRAPSARFLGTAYVLPAGGEPTIPVVTVNTATGQRQALPHRRPSARRRDRRRHVPDPALLVGDGRDRDEDRREGVGRLGRRLERDQPRGHDRHSRRRAAIEAEARRLHSDRRGGEQTPRNGRRRRRNGSSSPTSA